jgi:hypothetical protein
VSAAAADDRVFDAARSEQATVFVVVIAAIGEEQFGLLAGAAGLAATGLACGSSGTVGVV